MPPLLITHFFDILTPILSGHLQKLSMFLFVLVLHSVLLVTQINYLSTRQTMLTNLVRSRAVTQWPAWKLFYPCWITLASLTIWKTIISRTAEIAIESTETTFTGTLTSARVTELVLRSTRVTCTPDAPGIVVVTDPTSVTFSTIIVIFASAHTKVRTIQR